MAFCEACGQSVAPGTRFCRACGHPIDVVVAVTDTVVITPGDPPPVREVPRVHADSSGAAIGALAGSVARKRPGGVTFVAVSNLIGGVLAVWGGFSLLSYTASLTATAAVAAHIWWIWALMKIFPVLAKGEHDMLQDLQIATVVFFAIAVLCGLVTYGLWKLRKWGRILLIVLTCLSLLHAVVLLFTAQGSVTVHLGVILVGAWILWYFRKPHVKQAFGC